ncbi:unnamed protein product [Penicillium pancosmium]
MVDAAFYQKDLGEAYFFSMENYCRVRWEPYSSIEKRTWGPAPIKDHWKSLEQAGFHSVDAILPVEGVADELYFFRGLEVVRIKFAPKAGGDTITEGPMKTLDKWKSLAGTTIERVGAAIAVPGVPSEAYLFSGTNYVKIDVVKDKITYGPQEIIKGWPGLAKAGFDSVDAALQVPEEMAKQPGQYARVQVIQSKPDVLQWGPEKWEDHWKSLDWIAQQPSNQSPPSQDQSSSGSQTGTQTQPTKPLVSGKFEQSPMGRLGKLSFYEYRYVPVTGVEIWEGWWYANQYWGIRKVQLTWETGERRVFGTDSGAERYNAIWLNPRSGERITNLTTRIGEIWDYMSITTNRGQSMAAGGSGGVSYSWQLGNGVLLGFQGTLWPAEIVRVGPVWAQ